MARHPEQTALLARFEDILRNRPILELWPTDVQIQIVQKRCADHGIGVAIGTCSVNDKAAFGGALPKTLHPTSSCLWRLLVRLIVNLIELDFGLNVAKPVGFQIEPWRFRLSSEDSD